MCEYESDEEDFDCEMMRVMLETYQRDRWLKKIESLTSIECFHLILCLIKDIHGMYDVGPNTIYRLFLVKACNDFIQEEGTLWNQRLRDLLNVDVENNLDVLPQYRKWGNNYNIDYIHFVIPRDDLFPLDEYTNHYLRLSSDYKSIKNVYTNFVNEHDFLDENVCGYTYSHRRQYAINYINRLE